MVTRIGLVALLGALFGALAARGGALWPEAVGTHCCGAGTTAHIQIAWHVASPRRGP